MILLRNAKAVGPGRKITFLAVDGVAPYTYALEPDGIGGSIDAVTGVYTAPEESFGTDVVTVTDSTPVTPLTASASIRVGTPYDLVCDILETELGNLVGSVMFYNQKYNIPNDDKMHVLMRVLNPVLFGNKNQMDSSGAGVNSVQSINAADLISLDIYSRSDTILFFKNRIAMALNSNYAKQQFASNGFFVSKLPSAFVNLSYQEGAAMLYRFNGTFTLKYFQTMTKAVNYFDQFETPGIITNE